MEAEKGSDFAITSTLAFSLTQKGDLKGGHHVLLSTDYDQMVVVKESPHGVLMVGNCACRDRKMTHICPINQTHPHLHGRCDGGARQPADDAGEPHDCQCVCQQQGRRAP